VKLITQVMHQNNVMDFMIKEIVLLMLVLLFSVFIFAEEETPSYKTISSVVSGAITALESKDVDKLFKDYISPKDLKGVIEKGELEKTKNEFKSSEILGALLFVLKKLEKITPTCSKEKDLLTFKTEEIGTVSFSREDGKWYIKN
jgi:hypothetical protein